MPMLNLWHNVVAATRKWMNGWMWSPHKVLFYFVNKTYKIPICIIVINVISVVFKVS